MPKGKFWTHPKHGKRKYQGRYSWGTEHAPGERMLVLSAAAEGRKKQHNVVVESHEQAKELGWKRLK